MTTSTAQILLNKIETQAYRRGNFMCQCLDVKVPDERKTYDEIQAFMRDIADKWTIDRSSRVAFGNGDSPSIAQLIACAARNGKDWCSLSDEDQDSVDLFVYAMYSNWDDREVMVTEYITSRLAQKEQA